MPMTKLAITIVSWNVHDLLRRCIETIHTSLVDSHITYKIIVVDNASTDGTAEMIRVEHPEIYLLEPGRNLGFAGGHNLALRRLLESSDDIFDQTPPGADHFPPDYVLLLNPDTEIVDHAIAGLVSYMEEHPEVAVVGPRLLYPDGSAQSSRRRFPTGGTFFWESTPLEMRWPDNPWVRRYRLADRSDNVEQEVDWLVGAALLIRWSAIERVGLLDSGFAMYSEELEWQRRIKETGSNKNKEQRTKNEEQMTQFSYSSTIVYLPEATIIHHEGKSSEQVIARRYIQFQNSRLRYARMVYGETFATFLYMFLLAVYSLELAVEAAKWLLKHKTPLRRERVKIYWQVLHQLRKH